MTIRKTQQKEVGMVEDGNMGSRQGNGSELSTQQSIASFSSGEIPTPSRHRRQINNSNLANLSRHRRIRLGSQVSACSQREVDSESWLGQISAS